MESAVVKLEKICSDTEYSPTKKPKSKNKKSVTKSAKGGNKIAAAPKQRTYGSKAAAKQRGMNIVNFELWARIFYFIVLLILYLLPCCLTCMAKIILFYSPPEYSYSEQFQVDCICEKRRQCSN